MPLRTALLIGNGRFPKAPSLASLGGPANDVQHLAAVLGDPQLGQFLVNPLTDRTHYDLLEIIEETLGSLGPRDFALIYYSGHGKLDLSGQLCLCTVTTRLEALYATSIPVPVLKALIEQSRSNQVLLMLDCCFSGAAGKAFVRGSPDEQLAQQVAPGLHVLTSATSIQVSTEREHEAGGEVLGDFTRCVVEGIASGRADVDSDGRISLQEIREYLECEMRGQKPRYWGIGTSGDPVLAWNKARFEQQRIEAERKLLEEKRRRLASWYARGQLPVDIYRNVLRVLGGAEQDDRSPMLKRLIQELPLESSSDLSVFIAAWADLAFGAETAADEEKVSQQPTLQAPQRSAVQPNDRDAAIEQSEKLSVVSPEDQRADPADLLNSRVELLPSSERATVSGSEDAVSVTEADQSLEVPEAAPVTSHETREVQKEGRHEEALSNPAQTNHPLVTWMGKLGTNLDEELLTKLSAFAAAIIVFAVMMSLILLSDL